MYGHDHHVDIFDPITHLMPTRNTRSSRRSLIGADLIAVPVKSERTSNASGQRATKLAKRDSTARRRVSAPRRARDRRRENRLSV